MVPDPPTSPSPPLRAPPARFARDPARGRRASSRSRRPDGRRGPLVHAARRRQDRAWSGATAPGRPARSGCSPGSTRCSAGDDRAPRRDRLPAPGPAAAPRGRRRARADLRAGGARPRRPRHPPREGPRRAGGGRVGAPRRPIRTARGRVPRPRAATGPSRRCGRSRPASGSPRTVSPCRCKALSGGERRRLELTRILFGGSDLLLLDEPTNHLDVDAKLWLMKFLAAYDGALLVVSHDLGLLDASITRILHLDRDGVVEYRGTYSQYREARAARRAAAHRGGRAPGPGDPPTAHARRLDARTDPAAGPHGEVDGHAAGKLESARCTAPTHERDAAVPLPGRRRTAGERC